jgi:hypothetical protein
MRVLDTRVSLDQFFKLLKFHEILYKIHAVWTIYDCFTGINFFKQPNIFWLKNVQILDTVAYRQK